MQKEIWRRRWLSCINELTSLELQRRSWLDDTNDNPHWSFVEFMCSYFDDLFLDANYEYQLKHGWISAQELAIIQPWHNLLKNYNTPTNDDYDEQAILEDEDWHKVVAEGVKVKSVLSSYLSKIEHQILMGEINFKK